MIEEWKQIKGWEGQYEISNLGRVRGVTREIKYKGNRKPRVFYGSTIKPFDNGKGYLKVVFNKNSKKTNYAVHRLVAQAFIPNPNNKPVVNHKNGIRTDNRVDNLEWCTSLENHHHARDVLKHAPGKPAKPIRCVETGEVYSSLHEAAAAVGGLVKNFPRALKHGGRASGYHWEYV